jgi:hypothetical protein
MGASALPVCDGGFRSTSGRSQGTSASRSRYCANNTVDDVQMKRRKNINAAYAPILLSTRIKPSYLPCAPHPLPDQSAMAPRWVTRIEHDEDDVRLVRLVDDFVQHADVVSMLL